MKRGFISGSLTLLLLIIFSSSALPWGGATHAFFASFLGKTAAVENQNEVYGIIVPDMFNYMFGSPYQDYMHDQTHDNAMRLWKMARHGPKWKAEEALGFGFAAHNDVWGADYVAHWQNLTLGNPPMPPGMEPGYVIIKSVELEELLGLNGVWASLGIGALEYYEMRIELCHELVEVAGDVFTRLYLYPTIGQDLLDAIQNRTPTFPKLLARAYAGNLVAYSNSIGAHMNQNEAEEFLNFSELTFRGMMAGYAGALAQSDENVKPAIAQVLVSLASVYGLIVDAATAELALNAALYVISGTFPDEVSATIGYLNSQLEAHGVIYKK